MSSSATRGDRQIDPLGRKAIRRGAPFEDAAKPLRSPPPDAKHLARTNAGSIIRGAFRLVRDRPLAVLVWGVLYAAGSAVMGLFVHPSFDAMRTGMVSPILGVGQVLLVQLVAFLLVSILFTAAQRAVLRPSEASLFHMRLGSDELRMFVLAVVLSILFGIGMILAAASLSGMVRLALRVESIPLVMAMAIGVFLVAPVAACIGVRLSLSYPLTLIHRKILIGESWYVTRGRFWSLLGGYLVIFLIVVGLTIAAGLIVAGPEMVQGLIDPADKNAAYPAGPYGELSVRTVLGWIITAVTGGLTIALGGGAVATAAKDLVREPESLAREFE